MGLVRRVWTWIDNLDTAMSVWGWRLSVANFIVTAMGVVVGYIQGIPPIALVLGGLVAFTCFFGLAAFIQAIGLNDAPRRAKQKLAYVLRAQPQAVQQDKRVDDLVRVHALEFLLRKLAALTTEAERSFAALQQFVASHPKIQGQGSKGTWREYEQAQTEWRVRIMAIEQFFKENRIQSGPLLERRPEFALDMHRTVAFEEHFIKDNDELHTDRSADYRLLHLQWSHANRELHRMMRGWSEEIEQHSRQALLSQKLQR